MGCNILFNTYIAIKLYLFYFMNTDENQKKQPNNPNQIESDLLSESLKVYENQNQDILLYKIITNIDNLNIVDKSEWSEPRIGDKVRIVSWDTQSYVQECIRLSKLDYLTIRSIKPVIIGIGCNNYAWGYTITVNETKSNIEFMQWHYELI